MKTRGAMMTMAVVLGQLGTSAWADPIVFSSGLETPESISQAPPGFGSYGGQYFVPDIGAPPTGSNPNVIWVVPANGGSPTAFFTIENPTSEIIRTGMFLPPNFGSVGGQYVVGATTVIATFNSDGIPSLLADTSSLGYGVLSAVGIAPKHFGSLGGQLFFTAQVGPGSDGSGGVVDVTPAGGVSLFAATPGINPFGLAFAPHSFGSFGGDLLVSNAAGNQIIALSPSGQSSLFALIPNVSPVNGLRQIGFAPPHFGAIGGDLLVSVSGSFQGGGAQGALYALNSHGQIVDVLKVGTNLAGFDPRGFTFTKDGHILISDASDPIVIASPSDFVPFSAVPEISPSMIPAVLACLGGSLVIFRDRGRKRAAA
jgi:hypothetical protein